MLQSGPRPAPASHHGPDRRDSCPGEIQVALEVRLLAGSPRGGASPAEGALPPGWLGRPAGAGKGHRAKIRTVADNALADLVRRPVIVAPMAGGPTTPDLIAAAAQAGAVGFVAAGYKTAQAMRGDIDAVTAMTSEPCGVNVFVPGAPADPDGVARYLDSIAADAAALGTEPGPASWDDDDWHAKIADLLARPVPIVSFTFGCPEPAIVSAFQAARTSAWVTVTDPAEAAAAVSAGAGRPRRPGGGAGGDPGAAPNTPRGRPRRGVGVAA